MDIPLGKPTTYPERYDATLLAPLERASAREALGIRGALPFTGVDVWTAWEFSWLAPSGQPRSAVLRFTVAAESPRIVESKSMKLYLNGFALACFRDRAEVLGVLQRDLEDAFGAAVRVEVPDDAALMPRPLPGLCVDDQQRQIEGFAGGPAPERLRADDSRAVEEDLHTHLFRSLCPVTGQPDWASVLVRYRGRAIERGSLLGYLVSFRCHQGFHETAVEQIYVDVMRRCDCERLLIGGYFLRRGGIDINPFRADAGADWPVLRTLRQ